MSSINPFETRSTQIQYDQLDQLYYLGNYQRSIPVSLDRMMENAYDWEHLPFVHSTTFSDIKLVEEGDWGWRAEVGSAKSGGKDRTLLELLVDKANHYWATTVVRGEGEGVEIHTQASANEGSGITVDVRFYAPSKPNWLRRTLGLRYLQKQYRGLYDEDEELMLGRQHAIDSHKKSRQASDAAELKVGRLDRLSKSSVHRATHNHTEYCVAYLDGQWLAYSAKCPHQFGSLADAEISADGVVTCPWHGYRFDIRSGENLDGKCGPLKPSAQAVEREGSLYLVI